MHVNSGGTLPTRRPVRVCAAAMILVMFLAGCGTGWALNPYSLEVDTIQLPVPSGTRIGADIGYDRTLQRVVVPGGPTGNIYLVNPESPAVVETVRVFDPAQAGGARDGIVSVASGHGLLFAVNQDAPSVEVLDPEGGGQILASAPLDGPAEYIRFVPGINELWVTQPVLEQIQVFRITLEGGALSLDPMEPIQVKKGPVGLQVDQTNGLVYTNQPTAGVTSVYRADGHNLIRTFGNGCSQARGMALDEARNHLFIACSEGKLVLVDVGRGDTQVSSVNYGGELNQVSYNQASGHIYLPSSASAILGVFTVATGTPTPVPTGRAAGTPSPEPATPAAVAGHDHAGGASAPQMLTWLQQLGTADTALNANCVVADAQNNVWVCDPANGRLLLVKDTFK